MRRLEDGRAVVWRWARAWVPIVAGAACLATGPARAQTAATYHQRADTGIQNFLLKYWNQGQNYLNSQYPSNGSLASYWIYANAWRAVIDNVQRTQNQMYYGLIETLYNGQNSRGWSSNYYDDENWMVLTLMHAYYVTNDSKYLTEAESLYADIENGWDTSCCGSSTGGIWWDKAHTEKATASNAGPVIAGCRLYAATGNSAYLTFAEQVYNYWWTNMVNHTTYQVADHINTDGTIVWWKFTYNEGLMIGASRELYYATNSSTYLTNANNIAGFMINNEVESTSYGPALTDGTNSGCTGDAQQFKGPAYHYLNDLYYASPSSGIYNVLKGSADAIWNLALNSSLNIFSADWAGPPESSASIAQDNAACIALSDFASTYGAYPGSGIPGNQYEAENGTIHNVGLENTNSGFTGWAYLAGWKGDGEWVDFHPSVTSGTHTLTFRYAAGAGNATRLIYINGKNAFHNEKFPSTGSWSTWKTISVSYSFPSGASTVSVIYNSSLGSSNFLNLDNMVVN